MMSEILPEGASARFESEFWHRNDDIAMLDGRDVFADGDDAGLFDRLVNWGIDPVEHFREGADDATWTGWAAYVGYATPSSLIYDPSMFAIGHNAAALAFRYISVTPAAEQKEILARVAVAMQANIGIMIDDGVDATDGQGANNFIRWYLQSATLAGGPPGYEYEYRTGGGAVTTVTYTHRLANNAFYGLWISTEGTEWTSWNPRVLVLGEADVGGSLASFFTVAPAAQGWTPARVGIYYRNLSTSVDDRGIVDWFDHTF